MCNKIPVSFMQKLAACIQKDDAGNVLGINVIISKGNEKCKGKSLIDCSTQVTDWEKFVTDNAFGLDTCGKIALKLFQGDQQ